MKSRYLLFLIIALSFVWGCEECRNVSIPNTDSHDPTFVLSINGPGINKVFKSSESSRSYLLTLYAGHYYVFTLIGRDNGGISETWVQLPAEDRMKIVRLEPETATIRDVSVLSRIIMSKIAQEDASTCGTLSLKVRAGDIENEGPHSEGHISFKVYDYNNPPYHNSTSISIGLQYSNSSGHVGIIEL